MSFNYRVLAKKYKGDVYFDIHCVYYDNQSTPIGYSETPSTITSETVEEISSTLDKMKEALTKPIIWYGDKFPELYKEKVLHIVDFDDTLYKTPHNTEESREIYLINKGVEYPHKGWFGRVESLDLEAFSDIIKVNEDIKNVYLNKTDNDYFVLLTGRIPRFEKIIKTIMKKDGFIFDEYHLSTKQTLDFKLEILNDMVARFPHYYIKMYDDREEHREPFIDFLKKHKQGMATFYQTMDAKIINEIII